MADLLLFVKAHWIGAVVGVGCLAVPAACTVVKPEIWETILTGVSSLFKKGKKNG